MSTSSEPVDEKAAQKLFESVCLEFAAGRSRQQLASELVRQGWTKEAAQEFVTLAQAWVNEHRRSPEGRADAVQRALAQMQTGGIAIVGGIAFVAICSTVPLGLPTMVTLLGYGAILYGAFEFFFGAHIWWLNRESPHVDANVRAPTKNSR